jgi:hypothetical protein
MGQADSARGKWVQPRSACKLPPQHLHAASIGRSQDRQNIEQLALPVARDTRNAHDLTGVQLQAHPREPLYTAAIAQLQALG